MTSQTDFDADSGLILAAEECPPESFTRYHSFSAYDELILRKLSAHGPVLLRGGRGSGKSALLLEAHRRMVEQGGVFPVYVSLRYLPLLRSDGDEYIRHFCILLSQEIQKEINRNNIKHDFGTQVEQSSIQAGLNNLAQQINTRIVLLFDDAAHIGREKPLEAFFDLFRTISSNLTACKASIYPGVTKFGVRFDVFNDSTVIELSRSEIIAGSKFFPDVIQARYPRLANRTTFSDRLSPTQFANILGRAVVGNLRGLILACNRFEGQERIGLPQINKCLIDLATDYYWPLMEEVSPKLGVYEPLVEVSKEIMEILIEQAARTLRDKTRPTAPDRVLVHRQIVSKYNKPFEILEYLGFIARREASRGMKSGGRGPVFAFNMCSILDAIPAKRLTNEMIEEWISGASEPIEVHATGSTFQEIKPPNLPEEHGLAILDKQVSVLAKSKAYPYGLTENLIERLNAAGIHKVGQLADATDAQLDDISRIGSATIQKIRNVLYQAIWM